MLTAVMGLVAGDVGLVQQSHADLVEAVEQTVAAEGLHLEFLGEAEVVRDGLILEINRQVIGTVSVSVLSDALDGCFGQFDNQDSVVNGIVAEDVGERRRENHPEAEFTQCPCGVLARGAAAEVLAGDEDGGVSKCSWLSTKSSRSWPSE